MKASRARPSCRPLPVAGGVVTGSSGCRRWSYGKMQGPMDLRLTRRGDYTVRAALCLAAAWERPAGRYLKIREVTAAMDVPPSYTPQVLKLLATAGIAEAKAGPGRRLPAAPRARRDHAPGRRGGGRGRAQPRAVHPARRAVSLARRVRGARLLVRRSCRPAGTRWRARGSPTSSPRTRSCAPASCRAACARRRARARRAADPPGAGRAGRQRAPPRRSVAAPTHSDMVNVQSTPDVTPRTCAHTPPIPTARHPAPTR